ncbi:MAG TPA: OmpH family outer membrane protein [Flavobacteriaceae bacterium]|nr:OmpH family outer membrane protein [Flavobacteriaceae bacterium]
MGRRALLLIVIFMLMCIPAKAQRGLQIGYVDMEYILQNVPEYQEALTQLNAKAQKWKGELELKRTEIDAMKQSLANEKPLLTDELIEEREGEIQYEEEQLLALQQKYFGPTGDLIVQKRQLVQPVQDQVFTAIQEIGKTRQYDFIFDNSADALMLFSADRHDISDMVLNMIQRSSRVRNNEKKKEAAEEEPYKSVKDAAEDRKEEAERQAAIDKRERERQARLEERQRVKDSIRDARQAEFEARRQELLRRQEEQKRKRDSINKIRQENRNKD